MEKCAEPNTAPPHNNMSSRAFVDCAAASLLCVALLGCSGEMRLPNNWHLARTDANTPTIIAGNNGVRPAGTIIVPPRIVSIAVVDNRFVLGELAMLPEFERQFGSAKYFIFDTTYDRAELLSSALELSQACVRRQIALPKKWKKIY